MPVTGETVPITETKMIHMMEFNGIRRFPARDLITPERFDLMAKYAYAEYLLEGRESAFAEELYTKHIEAFSGGSFKEPGNESKNSAEAYRKMFRELIDSIKTSGYDSRYPVPVGTHRIIGDGAHRVAASAYLEREVAAEFDANEPNYNYEFFRSMYLDERYLDYIALKYVESSGHDVHVLCLWPAAFKDPEGVSKALQCISESAVVFRKTVHLSYNGMKNLMIQLYESFEWIGSPEDGFKGVYGKLDPCYEKNGTIEVFVIECSDEAIRVLKERVRECFTLMNHSCHSSDTRQDALDMARILLNDHSIQLLNSGDLSYDRKLIRKLLTFRNAIDEAGLDRRDIIADSSSILGVEGIRLTDDVDYISMEKTELPGFDDHEDYLKYYGMSKKELLYHPDSYAYVFGVKIITLDVLYGFKQRRASQKDLDDVVLIDAHRKTKKDVKKTLRAMGINAKRTLRNQKTAVRDFLEKHHIHAFTKLWHLLVGKGFR